MLRYGLVNERDVIDGEDVGELGDTDGFSYCELVLLLLLMLLGRYGGR